MIRLRKEPEGTLLRFGPDERDAAERMFEQLEFFEELNREPEPTPEVTPPRPGSALPAVPSDQPRRSSDKPRLSREKSRRSSDKPRRSREKSSRSSDKPRRSHEKSRRSSDKPRRSATSKAWVTSMKAAAAVVPVAAAVFLVAQSGLFTDGDLATGRSLFREGPGTLASPSQVAPSGSSSEAPPVVAQPAIVPGISLYSNSEEGFLFTYPDSWTVAAHGRRANLADPTDRVKIVFGPARSGALTRASEALVQHVERSHEVVSHLDPSSDSTAQGFPALTVGGTISRDDGEGYFLAIVVGGPTDNTSIRVFFSPDAGALLNLDTIRSILSSYRVGIVS